MCRQGLNNGEAVVIYKHPDDRRIFGQYTFKDEKCLYETVYFYVQGGKYEFTSEFELKFSYKFRCDEIFMK